VSFCIPPALAETWPPSPGDVGWVNPRTTAGSQANNIPLIKLPKQPSCFYWVQGHLLLLFLFICHIATCTFYLFPLSRAGLETGTMNEWMNEWTEVLTAPLPAYEECCQWACEWCLSSGHGYHYDIYFLTVLLSSDWNVPLCVVLLFIVALRNGARGAVELNEWWMSGTGELLGSWLLYRCCVDVLIKYW
jgi:hypothetical protein